MSHWLTKEEMEDMTGYKRKADQVRWLQSNRIHHTVRADGWARVPVSAIEARSPVATAARGPNFDAIRRAS
jgi:hypothetical protein